MDLNLGFGLDVGRTTLCGDMVCKVAMAMADCVGRN